MTATREQAPLIQLCEDEIPILRVTEMKFKNAGYRVRCAEDGVEGLEQIKSGAPDILITDCQMPRMDGMQLLRHVREMDATAKMPVILVTAKGLELDDSPIDEFGAIAVINKPFSPRELLALVDEVIAKSDFNPQTTAVSAES